MYIVIVGGGKVGRTLVSELLEDGFSVALIEKDHDKCEEIASKYNILVIHGDGADYTVLESAGTRNADFVVAVTGNDEVNFVVCQLAKISFKVRMTLARVNDSRNESIFKKLGIDFVFTTTNIISKIIHETIHCRDCGFPFVVPTFLHRKSKFDIIRLIVPFDSPSLNKKFTELRLPKEALAISLVRNEEIIIPYGDTILMQNDVLFFVLRKTLLEEVKNIIIGPFVAPSTENNNRVATD
jgi:trk system potassium uptake protein TrkA